MAANKGMFVVSHFHRNLVSSMKYCAGHQIARKPVSVIKHGEKILET